MAAIFHVMIERPRDGSPGAVARLAEVVAERYGIPPQMLREKLDAGRLKVKSNVDRETAETWVADLEKLGAVCAIVDAATGAPAPRPARKPPSPSYSSGLSAAFGAAPAKADVGAIDTGELSLATLDGVDDRAAAPSPSMLPASFGPPPEDKPARIVSPPPELPPGFDPFAPPEAEQPIDLDLAPDVAARPRTRTPAPFAPPPITTATSAALAEPAPPSGGLAGLVGSPRVRLAAGVLLAILLGFVPALIVTEVREGSAFDKIDRGLAPQIEAAARNPDDWDELGPKYEKARARKQETRRDIALGSMVIWALCGGAIAFAFFRKIDWDRVVARLER